MTVKVSNTDDPILDFAKVQREVGNPSRSTLWREWSKDKFPKPIQISPGRVGWLKSEIDDWKAVRAALRYSKDGAK